MFKSISGAPVYRYRDSQMQLAKSMQSMQEKKKKKLGHHPYNTDEHLLGHHPYNTDEHLPL